MAREEREKSSNAPIRYEVVERLGVLAKNSTGWTKELNLIAWNNAEPKFDIRDWDEEHKHMSKGITLKKDEAEAVMQLLNSHFEKTCAANA